MIDSPDKRATPSTTERETTDASADTVRNEIAHQRLSEARKGSRIEIRTVSENVIEGHVVFNEKGVLRIKYTTPPASGLDYIDITRNGTDAGFSYQFYGSVPNRPDQIRPVGNQRNSTPLMNVSFPELDQREQAMQL